MTFWTKHWDGPSQDGDKQLRVLGGMDLPYATKIIEGVTARRKGEFSEVEVVGGVPYLRGEYTYQTVGEGITNIGSGNLSPEDGLAENQHWKSYFTPVHDAPYQVAGMSARLVYAGDGFVLGLHSDKFYWFDLGYPEADQQKNTITWPVLERVANPGEQFPQADAGRINHSTSFLDVTWAGGLVFATKRYALIASGWGDTDKRYRFCFFSTYYIDGTDDATKDATLTPIVYIGDTGTQTMALVGYPYHTGRAHLPATPSVIGNGKIKTLHCIREDTTGTETRLDPYFTVSLDHGETWANETADFLLPFLHLLDPAGAPPRDILFNDQLEKIARFSLCVYMGDGQHLLVIQAALRNTVTYDFSPVAFVGTVGGAYTQIAWPPDAWLGSVTTLINTTNYFSLTREVYAPEVLSAQFGFGVGCVWFAVVMAGVHRFMFTHDFGATWEFADDPIPGGAGIPALIMPYVDAQHPGRLIFSKPDVAANRLTFMQCDGTFSGFKALGIKIKPGAGDTLVAADESVVNFSRFNYHLTNYGGERYKPSIHPAFPDDFNEPIA